MVDDVLDTFLSEYRHSKPLHHHAPQSHPHTPTQLSDEVLDIQSCSLFDRNSLNEDTSEEPSHFSIPELPIGRELVINILSTWGDRFYVGLTGLEIYTASGEPAQTAEVRGKMFSTYLHFTCAYGNGGGGGGGI